jgi:CDP-diacylglycerol--glycerol-3-phosphate 3-phosphatidyltransferase
MMSENDSNLNLGNADTPIKKNIVKDRFKYSSSAILTPANVLTVARLLLSIPFLFWLYYQETGWWLFVSFQILALSDIVDGNIARKNGPTTSGAFLDPLADKVLAIGCFVVLGFRDYYSWIPIFIMGGRELSVSVARTILAKYKISLPARKLGKAKTLMQMLAIGLVIFPPVDDLKNLHSFLLWAACALSIVSGIDLFINAQRAVEENKNLSS